MSDKDKSAERERGRSGGPAATPGPEGGQSTDPPGEGNGLEEAAKEAVNEIEKRTGTRHAGAGDIG
jgi:hypothetical protein